MNYSMSKNKNACTFFQGASGQAGLAGKHGESGDTVRFSMNLIFNHSISLNVAFYFSDTCFFYAPH